METLPECFREQCNYRTQSFVLRIFAFANEVAARGETGLGSFSTRSDLSLSCAGSMYECQVTRLTKDVPLRWVVDEGRRQFPNSFKLFATNSGLRFLVDLNPPGEEGRSDEEQEGADDLAVVHDLGRGKKKKKRKRRLGSSDVLDSYVRAMETNDVWSRAPRQSSDRCLVRMQRFLGDVIRLNHPAFASISYDMAPLDSTDPERQRFGVTLGIGDVPLDLCALDEVARDNVRDLQDIALKPPRVTIVFEFKKRDGKKRTGRKRERGSDGSGKRRGKSKGKRKRRYEDEDDEPPRKRRRRR